MEPLFLHKAAIILCLLWPLHNSTERGQIYGPVMDSLLSLPFLAIRLHVCKRGPRLWKSTVQLSYWLKETLSFKLWSGYTGHNSMEDEYFSVTF